MDSTNPKSTNTSTEKGLYPLSYMFRANDPPLRKDEARAQSEEGWGATHALLMASIIYPPDGSLSMYFVSRDGRTGEELPDIEWFKVWMLLTSRLANSKDLSENKAAFLKDVFQATTEGLFSSNGE